MLILTRKKGEGIVIGGNIKLTVLGIDEGKVKIGIDAPKKISIMRNEVIERIEESNREALISASSVKNLIEELEKFEQNKNK